MMLQCWPPATLPLQRHIPKEEWPHVRGSVDHTSVIAMACAGEWVFMLPLELLASCSAYNALKAASRVRRGPGAAQGDVDVLHLPERFTDLDVAWLSAYSRMGSRTPAHLIDGCPLADVSISCEEELFLAQLEEAAVRGIPLPPAPPASAFVGQEERGTRESDLPRLDILFRMASLADFLGHEALQALLAYHVARCVAGRSVPEIRLVLYPQLRLLPISAYTALPVEEGAGAAADAGGIEPVRRFSTPPERIAKPIAET